MNLNVPIFLDSKMIGIEKCETTTTTMMMMINEVNTMTPRQNDLVVKNRKLLLFLWFQKIGPFIMYMALRTLQKNFMSPIFDNNSRMQR